MKSKELKIEIIQKYLNNWVKDGGSFILNKDGTINVKGDVFIRDFTKYKLPFKFKKVSGFFNIANSKISTFENFPEDIRDSFVCTNCKMISLEFFPKKIGAQCYLLSLSRKITENEIRKFSDIKGEIYT